MFFLDANHMAYPQPTGKPPLEITFYDLTVNLFSKSTGSRQPTDK
ncbi:uncharacterized protein METZ01_LOCUS199517 [marine metagenome]|uniref:Uncharacterized protein n=1 Tax=marine metagenome TaxID=408172 RepID=A0A382E9K4_9ZZZZ